MESLIAIIFHLTREEFVPFVDRFVPVLLEEVRNSAWETQKVGIDAICAITMQLPDEIIEHRIAILQALKPSRFHKTKPVREAACWTIKLLKETNPPLEEHELAILDEHHEKKPSRVSIRD